MPHLGTYVSGGVTYDAHSGLPIEFADGYDGPTDLNPSVGVEAPAGTLDGVLVRNKDGSLYEVPSGNPLQILGFNPALYGGVNLEWQVNKSPDGKSWSISTGDLLTDVNWNGREVTPNTIVVQNGEIVPGWEKAISKEQIELAKTQLGIPTEEKEKINNNTEEEPTQEASYSGVEFGKVDKILQQLSLRNLKYPVDADYGNTQDYIQINQFTYRAINRSIFKETDTALKKDAKTNPSQISAYGVPQGTPKEKAIGLVKLPMPNSLADSNNVSWGPDQLNALTAAVSSAVLGKTNESIDKVTNFLQGLGQKNIGEGLREAITGISETVGGTFRDVGGEGKEIISQLTNPNSNLNTLGQSIVGSAVLNFLQFQVSPETILARGQGVIPNNNLALLFNSPTLREFTFSWKMSPRSREEAIRVNNILRFFKQGMAPKKASGGKTGGGSFFLGTPNIFDIHFKTAKVKDYEILDRNDSILRIKTCACTGAAVNYTPEGMWNAYEKGQPVAITLTLRFNELEPIFDTDYDNNYFNFDPQRTDLLPVPTDAVGY